MNYLYTRKRIAASIGLGLLVVTTGLMTAGCNQSDGADSTETAPAAPTRLVRVETMMATPGPFREMIQVTGVVDAISDATVSAEAGGRVIQVAELGSVVGPGSVVARFDERVLKSQLDAAETAYKLAEDTYRRQAALFEDSVISALEYENALARRDQAAASLDQARKAFADTRLVSPIRGRVEERFVEEGELASPGSPVVRVVDTRTVKIRAGVPERYAADIVDGAPVWIHLPAVGLKTDAMLTFVGRVVDSKSRTFPVEIHLENTSAKLKPEMVVDVAVQRQSLADALVVPQTALVRDDLGVGVYVIERRGDKDLAERRTVTTGPSFEGMVVVDSGLIGGEQVVVVGQSNLTDGNQVEVVSASGA